MEKRKLRNYALTEKLLIKCHPAGPVWKGSLGPEGCRTCLKMEALMLEKNRQNLEWCFWTPLRALSSLPYHWLCGFGFVQFIETNHSRFPWKQLLYFHSCSSSSPVGCRPQPVTTSTHTITETHSGNKCVFISFNPTYWIWFDFFPLFSNYSQMSFVQCLSLVQCVYMDKPSKGSGGQVVNGQKFF